MAGLGLDQPAPLSMQGNVADNWEKFKRRFLIYFAAIGQKKEKDEDKKIAIFCHIAGDEAIEFLSTVPEDDRKTLEAVLEVFDGYCCPKKNITVERFKFNTAVQTGTESVQAYVTRLKILASSCEFGDIRDDLIRDRIICGINDDVSRTKLLSKKNLTLEGTVDLLVSSITAKEGNTVVKKRNDNH